MGNSASVSHTQITDEQLSKFSLSLPGSYYHVHHGSNLPTSSLTNPNFDPSSSSPESVINNWELIQVFDDGDFDLVHYPNQFRSIGENPNANCNKLIQKVDDSGELLESYELVEHSEVSANFRQLNCTKDSNFNGNLDGKLISKLVYPLCYLSGTEDMVVLYYTSMRGIRKTYDDCSQVRMILKSYGAPVEERDVSMDSKYRKELENVFGEKGFSLPKVFIRGKCFGGSDEIKQLHEDGVLSELLEGFPVKEALSVCCSCGDARFVVCCNCNGSRKYFEAGEMRMCTKCNENGIIRCPGCCS